MSVAASHSRTSYILDKLQSLSGVIPIGAFLAEHFWSNSYALVSAKSYDNVSSELQLIPWRIFVESAVLWLPLLFHSFYGLYIWWMGKSNVLGHPWMSNWLFTLQRITGIIAFVFIGWHVYTERFVGRGMTAYADVQASMMDPWFVTFYLIGIAAASFHLGNGLWNFACKWGIAVSVKAQRAAGWFGAPVELFSIVPVKRSHSVCAQGGINAAKNLKGEGDSTWKHFDDTIYGGDFLANQPLVKRMCEAAPGIIDLLDRMGVTFNRTPEGLLDYRRFGGTLYHRTAFAGATTGQQLLYALDEQVRRHESEGRVTKREGWTVLSAVIDDGGT